MTPLSPSLGSGRNLPAIAIAIAIATVTVTVTAADGAAAGAVTPEKRHFLSRLIRY